MITDSPHLTTVIGIGISVAKQHSCKAQYHVTMRLSDRIPALPVAIIKQISPMSLNKDTVQLPFVILCCLPH